MTLGQHLAKLLAGADELAAALDEAADTAVKVEITAQYCDLLQTLLLLDIAESQRKRANRVPAIMGQLA